jgi:hypothetical protein
LEATKDSPGLAYLNICDSLGLAHVISVRYTQIPSGDLHKYRVKEKNKPIC